VATTLVEDNSDRLVERLRDGRLDLALIGWAGEIPPDIDTVVLVEEELVAAVHPGHPLADAGPIPLGALRDLPLITLPRGTGVRAALDAACAGAGFTPRIAFEASALPMVVQLAAQGLGLAVVPASIPNGPRILPITGPPLRSRLELAWPPAPSANPAARALIEQVRALRPPGRPVSLATDPKDRGPDSPRSPPARRTPPRRRTRPGTHSPGPA
jgi:DNA-binding transcriptional LysR family regulator